MEAPFSSARQRHLALVGICLGALLLRLWDIGNQSLWFDEGWSVHVAQQTLSEAIRLPSSPGHTHPPGYYVLLWGWVRAFGTSELAVRSLSAILGVASIAFTYTLARSLYDANTGLVAALLLAVNPAHWVYSQEARMYTMLCATLAALWTLHARVERERPSGRDSRFWLTLVLAETYAIYTHYFAALAIAAMALWALPSLWRDRSERRWRRLGTYLGCHTASLLLAVPIANAALTNASTHTTLDTVAPKLIPFVRQTWSFLLGGHIALAGRSPLYATLAKVAAIAVALAAVWLVSHRCERHAAVYLVFQIGVTAGLVWGLHQISPGYHPRYLIMVLPPLAALVARGVVALATQPGRIGWLAKLASLTLALVLLASQVTACSQLRTDGYYARDDARSVAEALVETLPCGAPVLLDIEDWALQHYLADSGLRVLVIDAFAPVQNVVDAVDSATAGSTIAARVSWYQGTTDMRGILGHVLERSGYQRTPTVLGEYSITLYDLSQPKLWPRITYTPIDWGAIHLAFAACDNRASANDAVSVSAAWHVDAQLPQDLRAAWQLFDAHGRLIAWKNTLLRDAQGRKSQDWAVGQTVVSFARVALPDGLAPIDYDLHLTLYNDEQPTGLDVVDENGAPAGKSAWVLTTTLTEPIMDDTATSDQLLRDGVQLNQVAAQGLELLGYRLAADELFPGQEATIELFWQATEPLPDHTITIELVRDDQVVASASSRPVYGQYPTTAWLPGQIVHEYRELPVPAATRAGEAMLRVRVSNQPAISLSEIHLSGVSCSFEQPKPQYEVEATFGSFGRLIGYDIGASAISTDSPVPLTLYWQGVAQSDVSYVVFAHLLDDTERLIAQHDGVPIGGQRPTTGWVQGEYLEDRHDLAWIDETYSGLATFEIGLYDPGTGQRVAVENGRTELLLPELILIANDE